MLRQIEYHPSTAPQTLAAVRSLERARQRTAGKLLAESRSFLENQTPAVAEVPEPREEMKFAASLPLSSISPPPPISKVLHDVYDDTTAPN